MPDWFLCLERRGWSPLTLEILSTKSPPQLRHWPWLNVLLPRCLCFPILQIKRIRLAFSPSKSCCAGQGWGSNLKDFGGVRNQSSKDFRGKCTVTSCRCWVGFPQAFWAWAWQHLPWAFLPMQLWVSKENRSHCMAYYLSQELAPSNYSPYLQTKPQEESVNR